MMLVEVTDECSTYNSGELHKKCKRHSAVGIALCYVGFLNNNRQTGWQDVGEKDFIFR